MTQAAEWRVNDTVAYDVMRETAATLTAHLLRIARADGPDSDTARAELAEVRRAVLAVNGFDRAAVDAHTSQLLARIAQLSGAAT